MYSSWPLKTCTLEELSKKGALFWAFCLFFVSENHLKLSGIIRTCSSPFQGISYRAGMYDTPNILTPNRITSKRLELTDWKHRTVNIKKRLRACIERCQRSSIVSLWKSFSTLARGKAMSVVQLLLSRILFHESRTVKKASHLKHFHLTFV